MSDTEIAKAMGLTTTQYRTQKSLAKDERRALDVARAKSLREDGLSLNEIAKEMGFANDSSVRSLLNENSEVRMNQAKTTAEFIKKQIDEAFLSQCQKGEIVHEPLEHITGIPRFPRLSDVGDFLWGDAALEIAVANLKPTRTIGKGDGKVPLAVVGETGFTKEFSKDIPAVYEMLQKGCEVARAAAAETLADVKKAMKINYFDDKELKMCIRDRMYR